MITPIDHLSRNGRFDRFFIDGEWRAARGSGQVEVMNPATEEVVTRLPLGNGEDVDAAVAAARRAFATWSRTKPEYRADLLDRLQALLEARGELIVDLHFNLGLWHSARESYTPIETQGRGVSIGV
ncbi:MAG: aldehyde dehydrogenase family protein [Novosphingobium sp.]